MARDALRSSAIAMVLRRILALSFLLAGCHRHAAPTGSVEAPAVEPPAAVATALTLDKGDGCLVEITREGTGRVVGIGDEVVLAYDARVDDTGPPVASTRDWTVPCSVKLGDPSLIRGLTRGIEGLKVGTEARIEVPPELAYGKAGKPEAGVPADARLVFEVRVVGVR
jgi:FKBP-type peptidyl-prolyl cis-trans isomerase